MTISVDAGARAAKSGVRAARKSVDDAIRRGHAQVRGVVKASERGASRSLSLAERIALGVVEDVAERGRRYVSEGRDRAYAIEGRLFPRRQPSSLPIALAAFVAGLLLCELFRDGRGPKTPLH